MTEPVITLLTTFAPFEGEREIVQTEAAKSFSRLQRCQVVVFDEAENAVYVCERGGFERVTGLRTGAAVGVDSPAFLMGDAFRKVKPLIRGQVVLWVNGDNMILPRAAFEGQWKPWELFERLNQQTDGDFVCLGRRLEIADDPEMCRGLKWHSLYQKAQRISHGVDVFAWSRSQFEQVQELPVLVDGWHYDVWLANDAYSHCENVYYLSGQMEVIHFAHKNQQRQITTANASTVHNRATIKAGMGRRYRASIWTPPVIPQELLRS